MWMLEIQLPGAPKVQGVPECNNAFGIADAIFRDRRYDAG